MINLDLTHFSLFQVEKESTEVCFFSEKRLVPGKKFIQSKSELSCNKNKAVVSTNIQMNAVGNSEISHSESRQFYVNSPLGDFTVLPGENFLLGAKYSVIFGCENSVKPLRLRITRSQIWYFRYSSFGMLPSDYAAMLLNFAEKRAAFFKRALTRLLFSQRKEANAFLFLVLSSFLTANAPNRLISRNEKLELSLATYVSSLPAIEVSP